MVPEISRSRLPLKRTTMTFRKTASVATIAFLTIAIAAPLARAQSVGVGSRGGVRAGGGFSGGASSADVLNSAAMGAAIGSAGGPIGMAIGAGVGLLHGLWAKKKYDEQARVEAERQQAMDRELERQMGAQRAGGGVPAGDGQGVLIVRDHLEADSPSASPATPDRATQVASKAPGGAADVDTEGFRPIYEGRRLLRREHRSPDGRTDVVLHYDTRGRIVRRDESTRLDGRLDTSARYVD